MYAHYLPFEAILTLVAPQLVVDFDEAIWGPHHRAALRLRAFSELDSTALAPTEFPADLIYAVATTPYVTHPSGRRSLSFDTLMLKRRWYRRERMRHPCT